MEDYVGWQCGISRILNLYTIDLLRKHKEWIHCLLQSEYGATTVH